MLLLRVFGEIDSLKKVIPTFSQRNLPINKLGINDEQRDIKAIRSNHKQEHTKIRFTLATMISNHSFSKLDFGVEMKYIRGRYNSKQNL